MTGGKSVRYCHIKLWSHGIKSRTRKLSRNKIISKLTGHHVYDFAQLIVSFLNICAKPNINITDVDQLKRVWNALYFNFILFILILNIFKLIVF